MNQAFTMHNIVLPDGTQTLPSKPVLSETRDVKDMILFAQRNSFKKVIDLGAGEGGYAIAFSRAGFQVTAVEPRLENIEKINFVIKADPQSFVTIECRTVEEYLKRIYYVLSKDTLILCLGLLYHLPNPVYVLRLITKNTTGLILSTHYALENHWQYDYASPLGSWLLKRICKRMPWLFEYTHYGLSSLTYLRGHAGRWYPEYPKGYKNISKLTHSSVHNYRSFWLTRNEISLICKQGGLTCIATEERLKGQSYTSFWLWKQ